MEPQIKIALPKGRLLEPTAALAEAADWGLIDYAQNARLYHLKSGRFSHLSAKIFQEKDIPIQVALGNYDLGICGLDWVEELLAKYPGAALVKLKFLGYGATSLYLAASARSQYSSPADLAELRQVLSVASEYPNLAESVALRERFKRFNIFPLWGAAEIYPPENADLVLIAARDEGELQRLRLRAVLKVLDSAAFLIANRSSLETKDLSGLLEKLPVPDTATRSLESEGQVHLASRTELQADPAAIRLALPDGHAQKHMVDLLTRAGIAIEDYPSTAENRRPKIAWPNTSVKVIRPQDMPLQVANAKFDLAVTGLDWVREHLYKFPSSPVKPLLDLKSSRVRIVVAIHNDLPAQNSFELRDWAEKRGLRLRLASEYVTIADKYARDNHLGVYRIIPTWGATEAFVPDEADLLIENTETGGTLKRHNLRIIETLFESTAWVIANSYSLDSAKAAGINDFVARLRQGLTEG